MGSHIASKEVANGSNGKEPIGQSDDAVFGVEGEEKNAVDYKGRAQWLRAGVLGANDGLVSTASLMVGVGAAKQDAKTMILSGVAALVAGACSMAIGEFLSVSTQRDVQLSDPTRRRDRQLQAIDTSATTPQRAGPEVRMDSGVPWASTGKESNMDRKVADELPKPMQAAAASGLAFTAGALVPLVSAAFIREYAVRVGVLAGVSSVALASFGAVGAIVGGSPAVKASLRVLIGGWIAMLLTYGLLRLFASSPAI